jgi:hypothetical protein
VIPPSAFPELPAAVVQKLTERGCQIPQLQRRKRHNVIHGAFLKPGQTDWAVLCTTKNLTELLVFPNGSPEQPMVIASSRHGFFKWAISPMPARDFPPEWRSKDQPLQLDHDAIGSFVEFGDPEASCFYCYSAEGKTLYFDNGKWIEISRTIVN